MDERVLPTIGVTAADAATTLVHPNYVLRVAGEPAARLQATWTGDADATWQRIVALEAASAAAEAEVSDAIAAVVPAITDITERRKVLDLRRGLHNRRPAKAGQLEIVRRHVDDALHARIVELDRVHAELASAQAAFAAVHARELAQGARSMRGLLEAANLRSALSYNNPELLQKLDRHHGEAPLTEAKAIRNLEDSLLQYYARASTKTSPLTSLTLMHVGRWREDGEGATVTRLSPSVARRVEVKAALLRHILDSWFSDYALVRQVFALTLNPTLREADGKLELQFVAPGREFIGRTWGTGVELARLDRGPILACVERAFADASGSALMADALVDRICVLAPKLPREAVDGFVRKLYELGYLVAQTGFVEQSDALEWAAGVVASLPEGTAVEARAAFARLQADLEVMRGDDVARRIDASLDINAAFAELAAATGSRRGGYLFRTPYYENCYFDTAEADLSVGVLDAHREELELIQQLNRLSDTNQQVQTSLCDYFVSRFGEDGTCSDVATFLEEFDATYTPAVMEGKNESEGIAFNSPRTEALNRARRAFEDYFKNLLRQGRDAQIDPQALRGIIAMLPQGMRTASTSYSYLVQTVDNPQFRGLVLNQIFGGRSGILSRFCEVLDADGEAQLRAYLHKGADTGRNVELGGVFGFNANRHPAMSDAELVVPPFGPSFTGTRKLPLSALKLRYLPEQHRLQFVDGDDRPVDIWYHGLLNPALLPKVHRAIALGFTEGPSFMFTNPLIQLIQASGDEMLVTPRLTLGNIVVSRRSWLVQSAACPDASLPAAEFYLAVRRWQRERSLPERFFVRAILDGGVNTTRVERYAAMRELNFKDLKPFYVDLRNPRFVRLLQNMMKRHALALFVTELLPDFGEHASTVAGETHVSELHFELTRQAVAPRPRDLNWYVLRIAYFADRRALVLGPIAEAIETAKREFGIEQVYFAPHWKYGPHVDLVVECDSEDWLTRVQPALQAILEAWIAAHPSTAKLDPAEYEQTSRWIGTMEIDAGPYLPLLDDNTVTIVPYTRPRTMLIPEIAESKERMHADCSELALALYRLKDTDKDAFFLTLHAMLAATAQTFIAGIEEGYMSMRSHADYFFAAHDNAGALRAQFDILDARRSADLDRATRASAEGRWADTGLPEPFQAVLAQWAKALADVDARSQRIVAQRRDDLLAQTDRFNGMATAMRQDVPDEFFERVARRRISEIGDAFLKTDAGREALSRPEFLSYRINVNLYYSLLPLLEVPPWQKFALCHVLANSVERVYGQDWRQKVAVIRASEEARS
jgi:hypothetical protein